MHIGFTQQGLYASEREIEKIGDRADNLKPVLEIIAGRMMDHERTLFETAGASVGRPWRALEPGTIKIKQAKGDPFPERPLSSTLNLMQSLTVRGHPDMILEVTDSFIRYGTKVPYSGFHATGTKDMPERRPIMFTAGNAQEYYRAVQKYLIDNELPHA